MVELNRKTLRDVDLIVLLAPIALTVFGCIGIYSTAPGTDFWKKQLIFLFIGIAVALVLTFTDYRKILVNVAPFFYISVMLLLVLVLSPLGVKVHGNQAWLRLAGFSLQPSEFAKLATILMLARYATHLRGESLTLRDMAIMAGIVIPPAILVFAEHDTGTTLTFGAILATFFFLSGVRKRYLAAGVAAVVIGLVGIYPHLRGYQKQRIDVIIHPENADPRGFGYQTIQSVIAVGSGGPFGKGLTKGTQGRLGFLPNAHTDFIGASVAEETGLAGILFMMALYLLFIWRMISIAQGSRDRAGALMIMGLIGLLAFHILCNLGMVVGLMPIMGIPLPLMSQGGTAVIAVFAGVGLALSVRMRRFVN
jgi:rod shape determining protein RodA